MTHFEIKNRKVNRVRNIIMAIVCGLIIFGFVSFFSIRRTIPTNHPPPPLNGNGTTFLFPAVPGKVFYVRSFTLNSENDTIETTGYAAFKIMNFSYEKVEFRYRFFNLTTGERREYRGKLEDLDIGREVYLNIEDNSYSGIGNRDWNSELEYQRGMIHTTADNNKLFYLDTDNYDTITFEEISSYEYE